MDSVLTVIKKFWYYSSHPLFEISGNKISLLSLLMAITVFVLSLQLAKMAEKFVKSFLDDKELDPGIKGSIQTIIRYLVVLVGALITLDTVGISMSSLAAVGAVFMVGIGFGLQNIASNFISGLIILLERPIKVGDLVEVAGVSGRVAEIRARSTIIHTRDDVAIIVPNSQFISEQVVNESFSGENIRLKVPIGVSYNADPKVVEESLLEVGNNHPKVLQYPAPRVFFKEFGDNSLNFDLTVWVNDIWVGEKILSDIRFSIMKKFKEESIEIPFPQRDIHIKSNDFNFSERGQ